MSSPSTDPVLASCSWPSGKGALYAAYIPFLEGASLCPRATTSWATTYVLLTRPTTPALSCGRPVAWVTPPRAAGNRTQGVGIQFPKDEKSRQLKAKIEELLGTALGSERPTKTI